MVSEILFYGFAVILSAAALGVITAKNPVHAVLFLVLSFITSSCLWLMLNVEFLALVLIIVYVGAVMVLFLFVVMMLNIDIETMRAGFWKNFPLALLVGVVALCEIIFVILKQPLIGSNFMKLSVLSNSDANYLGYVLYTQYAYPVELASMLLLLGLIVAVSLALRKTNNKIVKFQKISKQVNVDKKDRITLIDLKSDGEL